MESSSPLRVLERSKISHAGADLESSCLNAHVVPEAIRELVRSMFNYDKFHVSMAHSFLRTGKYQGGFDRA